MNRIRSMFAAVFLAAATLSPIGVSACASLGIEQPPAPRTVNEALAETEVAFIGVIYVADRLHAQGLLSDAQRGSLLTTFVDIADRLDTAHALAKLGKEAEALITIAEARRRIDERSRELGVIFNVRD